jgi:hypothetical protein
MPRFQIRRQRLHVNLVNGNRLIGFLNQADDDEDEDLFHEAEDRAPPTESIGLAIYDKSTVSLTPLNPMINLF